MPDFQLWQIGIPSDTYRSLFADCSRSTDDHQGKTDKRQRHTVRQTKKSVTFSTKKVLATTIDTTPPHAPSERDYEVAARKEMIDLGRSAGRCLGVRL